MNRKRMAVGVAAATVALTLTGCSGFSESFEDVPISNRDKVPAEVVNMPDVFANVATKCNHGNRLYVTSSNGSNAGKAVAVVPNDPSCIGVK